MECKLTFRSSLATKGVLEIARLVQLLNMKGGNMSHSNFGMKNKKQKHPRVDFRQYLYNTNEPRYTASRDVMQEYEVELLGDSHYMRRRFRQNAKNIRNNLY